MSNPANDYVRDFVQDVPRSRVLTAKSIMVPIQEDTLLNETPVRETTTLEELIPIVAPHANPVAVIDGSGMKIGQIDRASVMMALARHETNS